MSFIKKIKWWQWLIVVFFLSYFFIPDDYNSDQLKAKEEREARKQKEHEEDSLMRATPFEDLTLDQKEKLLTNFLESKKEPYQTQRFAFERGLDKAFRQAVKFPSTLKYLTGGWSKTPTFSLVSEITNMEKGEITIYSQYKSENSFGQEVQENFTIVYSYDGNLPKIIDSKLK